MRESRPEQASPHTKQVVGKPKIVVIGTGWSSISFLKTLKRRANEHVDVTLVSPRNYFLYSPLLPSASVGTVEQRSIVEPVRKMLGSKANFYEAAVQGIDVKNKTVTACFPDDNLANVKGMSAACFQLEYDILVLGVGSINNTFGIEGVKDHCLFFKSIEDATKLRRQIAESFERAALPGIPDEEIRQLLTFVIVGGGPTGVEVAAELHDLCYEDLKKVYPRLMKHVAIKVVELQDHVLGTYDRAISDFTRGEFERSGIQLVLNSKVQAVSRNSVQINTNGSISNIPFGACIWSTGVAMHPLVKQLQAELPEGSQTHFRSIVTDAFLRVKGSDGSIYAIGDAATIEQERAVERVGELFEQADTNNDGNLSMEELRVVMKRAAKEYPHLDEHSRFLEGKYGQNRWGGLVRDTFERVGIRPGTRKKTPMAEIDPADQLDKASFEELLTKIDSGLRALPATAQVAKQEGEYLAKLLGEGKVLPAQPLDASTKPFVYTHKGSLAYVGSDKAVMDVPNVGPLTGRAAGFAWKGFETFSQISLRNMASVATDWIRTKIWGRDLSKV